MSAAYPPPEKPQQMGMVPQPVLQQPSQHGTVPGAASVIYQHQHHQHGLPPNHHPPPPQQQQQQQHAPPVHHAHTHTNSIIPSQPPYTPRPEQQQQQQQLQPQPQPQPQTSRNETTPQTLNASDNHPSISPETLVFSRIEKGSGRKFELRVVQQPERARMCGYGDKVGRKDRRPITPPPCVRLDITDMTTGLEIPCREIDYSMFVLNVDLWDEAAESEVNLCRQPNNNAAPAPPPTPGPSSVSSVTSGYNAYPPINGADPASARYLPSNPPPPRDMNYLQHQPPHPPPPSSAYAPEYGVPPPSYTAPPSYPPGVSYGPPQQYFPQHQAPHHARNPGGYMEPSPASVAYVNDQYKGALNRNLIGSVAASAFCLSDTGGHEGIFFVLQDLSVRLEGKYRLRFSFVNIGYPGAGTRDRPSTVIHRGRTPILSACFSNSFQVFSAKKFPGVCESTALSKTFATQGIKIPIRKDGAKGADDEEIE